MYNPFTAPNWIFGRIDQFWKDLVCKAVYGFSARKSSRTLNMLLNELEGQYNILFSLRFAKFH